MEAAAALLPRPYSSPSDGGDHLLHEACHNGMYEDVLMFILSGEDVMARNKWMETPLHRCTAQGHLEVMLLLLDSGASVNARDHQNITPLHQAVIHCNKPATELLLSYCSSIHNNPEVTNILSVQELAKKVHVCHRTIMNALGRVWPLQHLCRITIRRNLGAARRKRLKELPLPKHLISYLYSLPVQDSARLHHNWDRIKSSKCEEVRKRGVARRTPLIHHK